MCHESCPYPISGGAHFQEQDHTIPTTGGSLPILVVMPEKTPAAAVLIIHDIYGAGPFYQDIARRLADAGYIAALPDFFFRQGPVPGNDRDAARERGSRVDQSEALDDLRASLTWLRQLGNGRVGTIGMCWGGTMVLLGAGQDPTPDASVCYYGFPVRERTPTTTILPIDDQEIARLDSPLLGFWGEQDAAVGMDTLAAYDTKLTDRQIPHDFTVFPDVGHAFLTFDPASAAYPASSEAWTRTLAFYEAHLQKSITA